MREIKFRGKRIDNGEWAYGYYWTNEFGNHFIKKTFDDKSGAFVLEDYEIDAETVGQYTGLKDKNSIEIYEGDIVEFEVDRRGKIEWDSGEAAYIIEYLDVNVVANLGNYYSRELEIIGNIYDDSELIEQ